MTADIVFLAGILSFFSPCTLPLLPVYFAELAAATDSSGVVSGSKSSLDLRLILRTLLFVAGLSTSFVIMGFGAGLAGELLGSQFFLVGCGILVIVLGIHQTGLIRFRLLERQKKWESSEKTRPGIIGAFLLGFTFSFGWTPCVGPVLATVLALASNQGESFGAAVLMLVYSAGLSLPFVLLAFLGARVLGKLKKIHRHLPKIQVASGILIIIMGVLLMTDNLNVLTINF
jgi:cytochrome c biogenesis protein CcdA